MRIVTCIILFVSLTFSISAQADAKMDSTSITQQTQEIIDTLLSLSHHTIPFVSLIQLRDTEHFQFWNEKKHLISKDEYFDLISHPSVIIRFYAYMHVIDNHLTNSKIDFIKQHLEDVEMVQYIGSSHDFNQLLWILKDGEWIKSCKYGFHPVIWHVIKQSNLTSEELQIISNQILAQRIDSEALTILAMNSMSLEEACYPSVKSLAYQNDQTAISKLAEFKHEEDQDFLLSNLDSIFRSESRLLNRNFVRFAIENDFPKGSINLFYEHHTSSKLNGELYLFSKRFGLVYYELIKSSHPLREELLIDLLDAVSLDSKRRKEYLNFINSLLGLVKSNELMEVKSRMFRELGGFDCNSLKHLQAKYPDQVHEVVKEELERLKDIGYRGHDCFGRLIEIYVADGKSPEEYINLALKSRNTVLPFRAAAVSGLYQFPSSKMLILNLMQADNKTWEYEKIIYALSDYKLTRKERVQIKNWITPFRTTEDYKKSPYNLDELLAKMEVKLSN